MGCCSSEERRVYALREKDIIVEAREHRLGYWNINPSRVALHLNTVARDYKISKSDFKTKAANMSINVEGIEDLTTALGSYYKSV